MTSTTTAEVVTLEASVRVLQVGNRQITQSVAKQLDRVEPWFLEPMGRIRLGDEYLAIGKDRRTSDLVLSYAHMCDDPGHAMGATTFPSLAYGLAQVEVTWRRRDALNWERASWSVLDAPPIEPDNTTCACCEGCDTFHTGRYVAATSRGTGEYSHILPDSRYRIQSDEQEVSEVTQALVHLQQSHSGTGNRFGREWIKGLPLIVLAGLR